ncbi:hypothetical protein [Lysobacter solisilvae (ex Woo and Kim 2020)]|uniref:Uncharacterized protein n=1 Tax=Agrilutibacter terrestris TaxID=2865112 RepID=A0A7H0FX82_9GAMM|nr:hypothetical protein [Lysobacter terrestris]QNP40648.1 hypothetical protein H8B22_14500 [Lysobacter terrestris]
MEIHRADKAYRRRASWFLAAIAILCGVLLWQLQAWLAHVTQQLGGSDPATVRLWVRSLLFGLGIALAVPAVGLGLTLRKLGYASRIEGRFPPAEFKTVRDVRILRDSAGLSWARRVELAGSGMLLLAGVLVCWAAWAWWHFRG